MTDQSSTSSADASGDAGNAPDYRAKYDGLQAAFQKRQNDWTQREQAFETERADYEAKVAKLAEYEAREAQEREEAQMQSQYEALKERFDPNPRPMVHNEARDRSAGKSRDDGSAEYAYDQMAKALGTTRTKTSWP